jgi:hypothetical protein
MKTTARTDKKVRKGGISMALREVFWLEKSECEYCGEVGHVVQGSYEDSYQITRKPFAVYCREQMEEGTNIIHYIGGCQKCAPL